MKLLEVFKDFEVMLEGSSQWGRYRALYRLVPVKNRKKVTLQDLERYAKSLQMRYPDKEFYLKKVKVKGKEYYVIAKKCIIKVGRFKKIRQYDRIPIYIDLENQKFYVPKSYVETKSKLTAYILMRVLGTLGVAKVRYVKMLGARSPDEEARDSEYY